MNTLKLMRIEARSALKTAIRTLAAVTAAVSLFGGLATPVHATNPIMHNSSTTSSTKWTGGWGNSAGSKYGKFTCNTCHTAGLQGGNSKKIKSAIYSPKAGDPFPGEGVTVAFSSWSTFGNPSTTPRTTSNRVCEVCHSLTTHHKYGSGSTSHYDDTVTADKDCTVCHFHSTGFKPAGGTCNSCHGDPPTTRTLGATTGLVSPSTGATGISPGTPGAHATHNTRFPNDVANNCTICHNGNTMPTLKGQIQMGFNGLNGRVTNGTFTGYTTLNSETFVSSSALTVVKRRNLNYNICSVYCHGGGSTNPVKAALTGGSVAFPNWTTVNGSQKACGACHGTTSASPPTMGSHSKHAGTYAFACTKCHYRVTTNAHVRGNVFLRLSTGSTQIPAGATYNGYTNWSTNALAPSASYSTCAGIYCHSYKANDARTNKTGYQWGTTLATDCTGCHGNDKNSTLAMTADAHKAHMNNTATSFAGMAFKCYECHFSTVQADNRTLAASATGASGVHANGTATVVWGPLNNGKPAYTGGSTCATSYCHSDGAGGAPKVTPAAWNTVADSTQGTQSPPCAMCHGGLKADSPNNIATKKHARHIGIGENIPHADLRCQLCHRRTATAANAILTNTTGMHINGTVTLTFLTANGFTNRTGLYRKATDDCLNTYCHGTAAATPTWGSVQTRACGDCHGTSNVGLMSAPHNKHYNTATNASGWTNTVAYGTGPIYVIQCGVCHNVTAATNHVNGPQVAGQGDAEVVFNLPFGGGTNSVTKGGSPAADGKGYYYSTATSCSVYCHSSGKAAWAARAPTWTTGSVICGNCHAVSSNKTYSADWSGAHLRHIGPSSTNVLRQYSSNSNFKCSTCHVGTVVNGTSTTLVSTTNRHVNGFRNVSANTWAGTTAYYNTVAQTCSNIYCHSNGRVTGLGYNATPAWTGTLANGCLSCHGGKNAGVYSPSSAGFKLSTTHQRHIGKYPANIDCNNCHAKTAASSTALKDYSGVRYHANKTKNVTFTGLVYSSYTSYKATKNCGNVSCHGGLTRTTWIEGSPGNLSNDYTCVKCHGVAGTTTGTNIRLFAPGYVNPVTLVKGTDTGQSKSRAAIKAGAHFKHLSSMYMKKLHCNECHIVPSGVFDAGHNNIQRYGLNTGVLKFDQASSARWDGQNLVQVALASFNGFTTAQNANKAATCSQIYCHGNRLKNNEVGGNTRKPFWNNSGMINYTAAAGTVCTKCHGYPPTAAGHTTNNVCSGCHLNISTADNKTFIDKSKHINRTVEVTLSCKGCHGVGATKDIQTEFAKNSHHTNKAWASIVDADCVVCHAEGSISGGVITVDTSVGGRHGGTSGVTGVIDLYNADNRATIYSITLTSLRAHDNASNASLDTFCMSCHDSGGATAVTSGNGFTDGRTATNPFNDGSLSNSYDQQVRAFGAAPAALNVYDAFDPTRNSHHAVRGARYTATTGLAFGTSLSAAGLLSSTVTLASGTTGVTDTSTLHCSDCHSVAWSAHGGSNEYLLQTATSENPTVEHTVNTDVVCAKCHSGASSYAGAGNHTGNGGDEVWTNTLTGTARATGNGHITGIACLNCHDGNVGFGGIHGVPNATYTAGGSGGTYNKRRFMPGSSLYQYDPSTAEAAGSDNAWGDPASSTAANKCYTLGTAGSVGSCTKHSGGVALGKRNVWRPATY